MHNSFSQIEDAHAATLRIVLVGNLIVQHTLKPILLLVRAPPQLESYNDSGLWMPIEEVHCNAAQRESQGGFCHKHRHPRCDAVCAQRCHLPRPRPARLQHRLLTLAHLPKRQSTMSTAELTTPVESQRNE
jgi:hypothetical protein